MGQTQVFRDEQNVSHGTAIVTMVTQSELLLVGGLTACVVLP